jgi:hypothetical protein
MHVWADIEDATGAKIGAGPLDTVSDTRLVKRLSRAGEISFTAHINDPNLAYFLQTDGTTGTIRLIRKTVTLRGIVNNGARVLGRGIIERVTYAAPDRIRVEGSTLLRELAYRRRFGLFADSEAVETPTVVWWDGANFITVNSSTDVSLLASGTFLYVGYLEPFNIVHIDMGATVNAIEDSEGSWGFSRAISDPIGAGWTQPDTVDGTILNGAPFGQDGDIEFVRPKLWEPVDIDGNTLYWMRFDPAVTYTANIRFADIDLTILRVIANDIEQLIDDYNTDTASATPPQWDVDTTDWYDGTANGTLRTWRGETYLEILTKINEQTGENFREGDGNGGREIEWLRNDIDDSDFLLVTDPNDVNPPANDEIAYIASFEDAYDAHEIMTRVYVPGAGNGDEIITMANTDRVVPAGYTLDPDGLYLEKDSAITAFGRIDGYFTLPDVGSPDEPGSNAIDASNALFDAGKAALDKYSVPYRGYRLSVTGLSRVIDVGTEINILYRRVANGAAVWMVQGTFTVLETTNEVNANGLFTSGLMIANVTRFPVSDGMLVANQLRNFLDYKRHPQGVSSNSVR